MIKPVGAAKEYFRKDDGVLSKWRLQKQGSVNQRKSSGKDRSDTQGAKDCGWVLPGKSEDATEA